jgi:hypothetical protein
MRSALLNRRRWFLSAIAVLAGGAGLVAKENLLIIPIVTGDDVLVSFELTDAYTADVREAIASGLRTTFGYDVALRMKAPGWLDRTIVTAVVSTTDQYDNLTRRHLLSRTVDGRLEETLVTEDETVVARWLTKFTRLPVCKTSKLEPGGEYYLRISARSRPRGDSFLGWASAITSQAKFTFIR